MKYLFSANQRKSFNLRYPLSFYYPILICIILGFGNYAYPEEGSIYSIHLFTYKTLDEAKVKVKELNDLGYNAFFRQETSEKKETAYEVYVEKFKTKSEAEKEAGILKDLDLISNYDIREIHEIAEKKKDDTPARTATTKNEVPVKPVKVKAYQLKVSSLKEEVNAEELVKQLQDAGYQASYRYETVKDKGDWYRVYVEGYLSKKDAANAGEKIKGLGLIDGYELMRATGKAQPVKPAVINEKRSFSLHVSSYKDSALAEGEVARLRGNFLTAFFVKTDISGEQWYRVYVGEFSDEKEARKFGDELIKKGLITYFKPYEMGTPVE
jgi:cell division septation protein DedD